MLEIRSLQTPLEVDAERPNTVRGYAAVFNSPSEVLAEDKRVFRELVLPGAFRRSIATRDVLALWNHGIDGRPPLGRNTAGTLRLSEDERGLRFELDLPDTAADVRQAIARRDVWGMSFGFPKANVRDRWFRKDGQQWRELQDLDLAEVSVVIHPAYPATSVRDVSAAVPPAAGPDLAARARRVLMLAERS